MSTLFPTRLTHVFRIDSGPKPSQGLCRQQTWISKFQMLIKSSDDRHSNTLNLPEINFCSFRNVLFTHSCTCSGLSSFALHRLWIRLMESVHSALGSYSGAWISTEEQGAREDFFLCYIRLLWGEGKSIILLACYTYQV